MKPGDFVYFENHIGKYHDRVIRENELRTVISLLYNNGSVVKSDWYGMGIPLTISNLLKCEHLVGFKEETKIFIKEALIFLAKD